MDSRCKNAAENKNAAKKSDNPCLLAGIVVCAHCGAKMSAFLHKDRYKLADGKVVERTPEEMDADWVEPEQQPDPAERLRAVEETLAAYEDMLLMM